MNDTVMNRFVVLAVTLVSPAFGQKWEIGAGAGAGFFTSQSVQASALSGEATLANAVDASFWLGNNTGRLLGGEVRYDYENSSLKVSSAAQKATFAAQTHSVHYDFLLHFTPQASRVRPFVLAGAGIEDYRGTGTETAFQPLANLAVLTKASQVKPLLRFGAGVKVRVSPLFQLRFEMADSLTPFPTKVISPAQSARLNGWIQNVVVMGGLALTF